MTIEKFKRVMWRIKERNENMATIRLSEVRRAIMHEIGTDERTIHTSIKRLIELKYLKRHNRYHFSAINVDDYI